MLEDKGMKQGLLMIKKNEIDTCNQQIKSLKRLKKNIQSEMKKWLGTYKKHNAQQVTKEVVVRKKFEGNKAKEIQALYHGKVYRMNSKYMQKIIKVCETMDLQISAIETYIGELENCMKQLQNEIDNMEG